MYFENKKLLEVDVGDKELTMEDFIDHLKRNYLKEKEEMFV